MIFKGGERKEKEKKERFDGNKPPSHAPRERECGGVFNDTIKEQVYLLEGTTHTIKRA